METSSSFTSLASDSNSPQVSKKNLDNDSIEETPDETAVNPWENDMNDKELQIIGKRIVLMISMEAIQFCRKIFYRKIFMSYSYVIFRTYRLGNSGEKRES